MTKKTGFFGLFIFILITGTAHLAAMEQEKEKTKPNSFIAKVAAIKMLPVQEQSKENKKLPILCQLPIIGYLFKKSEKAEKLTVEELKIRAAKSITFYEFPCGAGASTRAVQDESSSQQPPSKDREYDGWGSGAHPYGWGSGGPPPY